MKINVRWLRLSRALLGALLALGACTEAEQDAAQSRVYRHSLPGVPADLDPSHSGDRYSGFITQNLFQTLYAYQYLARPYRLKPQLAAGFPQISADGLGYRFRLRPGQRFADDPAFSDGVGREVIAADVVYSLKRHFDPATRSQGLWLWRGRIAGLDEWGRAGADHAVAAAGLRVTGRYQFEVVLTAPYPQLIHTLANPLAAVVAREAVERYGREFGVRPVGSGPYRLESFDTARAVLDRNSNYPRDRVELAAEGYLPSQHAAFGLAGIDGLELPLLERVIIDFIPDDAARWLAFVSDGGPQFLRLPADQIGAVIQDPQSATLKTEYRSRYRAASAPELGFVRIDFNMGDPDIGHAEDARRQDGNRRLRCAVAATIDWPARNRTFYHGMGVLLNGLVPPADGIAEAPRGQPAAPALADLGLNAAPLLSYGYLAGLRGRQEYEFFRDRLLAAGYPEGRIGGRAYANFADLVGGVLSAQTNVYMLGWVMDYPDPINNFELFYGPNAAPGANYSRYHNPEYDALFRRASRLPPSPARETLIGELQTILDRDCVTVPGVMRRSVFMFHRDVVIYPDNGPHNGTLLRYVGLRGGLAESKENRPVGAGR